MPLGPLAAALLGFCSCFSVFFECHWSPARALRAQAESIGGEKHSGGERKSEESRAAQFKLAILLILISLFCDLFDWQVTITYAYFNSGDLIK